MTGVVNNNNNNSNVGGKHGALWKRMREKKQQQQQDTPSLSRRANDNDESWKKKKHLIPTILEHEVNNDDRMMEIPPSITLDDEDEFDDEQQPDSIELIMTQDLINTPSNNNHNNNNMDVTNSTNNSSRLDVDDTFDFESLMPVVLLQQQQLQDTSLLRIQPPSTTSAATTTTTMWKEPNTAPTPYSSSSSSTTTSSSLHSPTGTGDNNSGPTKVNNQVDSPPVLLNQLQSENGQLRDRITSLIKEVRFCEQSCVELGQQNQFLHRQLKKHKKQNLQQQQQQSVVNTNNKIQLDSVNHVANGHDIKRGNDIDEGVEEEDNDQDHKDEGFEDEEHEDGRDVEQSILVEVDEPNSSFNETGETDQLVQQFRRRQHILNHHRHHDNERLRYHDNHEQEEYQQEQIQQHKQEEGNDEDDEHSLLQRRHLEEFQAQNTLLQHQLQLATRKLQELEAQNTVLKKTAQDHQTNSNHQEHRFRGQYNDQSQRNNQSTPHQLSGTQIFRQESQRDSLQQEQQQQINRHDNHKTTISSSVTDPPAKALQQPQTEQVTTQKVDSERMRVLEEENVKLKLQLHQSDHDKILLQGTIERISGESHQKDSDYQDEKMSLQATINRLSQELKQQTEEIQHDKKSLQNTIERLSKDLMEKDNQLKHQYEQHRQEKASLEATIERLSKNLMEQKEENQQQQNQFRQQLETIKSQFVASAPKHLPIFAEMEARIHDQSQRLERMTHVLGYLQSHLDFEYDDDDARSRVSVSSTAGNNGGKVPQRQLVLQLEQQLEQLRSMKEHLQHQVKILTARLVEQEAQELQQQKRQQQEQRRQVESEAQIDQLQTQVKLMTANLDKAKQEQNDFKGTITDLEDAKHTLSNQVQQLTTHLKQKEEELQQVSEQTAQTNHRHLAEHQEVYAAIADLITHAQATMDALLGEIPLQQRPQPQDVNVDLTSIQDLLHHFQDLVSIIKSLVTERDDFKMQLHQLRQDISDVNNEPAKDENGAALQPSDVSSQDGTTVICALKDAIQSRLAQLTQEKETQIQALQAQLTEQRDEPRVDHDDVQMQLHAKTQAVQQLQQELKVLYRQTMEAAHEMAHYKQDVHVRLMQLETALEQVLQATHRRDHVRSVSPHNHQDATVPHWIHQRENEGVSPMECLNKLHGLVQDIEAAVKQRHEEFLQLRGRIAENERRLEEYDALNTPLSPAVHGSTRMLQPQQMCRQVSIVNHDDDDDDDEDKLLTPPPRQRRQAIATVGNNEAIALRDRNVALEQKCRKLREYIRKLTQKCEDWSESYERQGLLVQQLRQARRGAIQQ